MLPRMTPGEQTDRLSAVVCDGGWNDLHLLDEDDIYLERVGLEQRWRPSHASILLIRLFTFNCQNIY